MQSCDNEDLAEAGRRCSVSSEGGVVGGVDGHVSWEEKGAAHGLSPDLHPHHQVTHITLLLITLYADGTSIETTKKNVCGSKIQNIIYFDTMHLLLFATVH